MEEKMIISLYVVADSQNRDPNGIYDGIYDVSEALEAFKAQSTDNQPAIGIKIHKRGSKAASDIMLDIMVGEKIYMEPLEYLPGMMRSEKVYSYIAELLAYLPAAPISGKVPDEIRNLIEKYAISHKTQEQKKQNQLIQKLDNLMVDALKFAESPRPDERAYAEDLLKYITEQHEMLRQGATEIDLQKLPSKEEYISLDTDRMPESKGKTVHKTGSLLGKLYQYQKLINQFDGCE